MAKSPNPVDKHVGSRVRFRRMMLSVSQEKLGEQVGITFQQVQKYEKGTNRIGASRLLSIANVLGVPVDFFFEDAPGAPIQTAEQPKIEAENVVIDFLYSAEGLHLNRAFTKIKNEKVRLSLVNLIKALAEEQNNS